MDRYLDCFQMLAVMYNAAMNIGFLVLCGHTPLLHLNGYLGVGLLGRMIR